MVAVNTLTIDVLLNGKKAQMGLKQFSKELSKIQKSALGTNKSLKSAFSGFSGINGILGIASVAGLTHLVKTSATAAKNIDELSKRTGMLPERIRAIGKAFEVSGGKTENVEKTIRNISDDLYDLQISGKPSALLNALSRLVGVRNERGELISPDEAMLRLSDWTQKNIQTQGFQKTFALLRNYLPYLSESDVGVLGKGREELSKLIDEQNVLTTEQNNNLTNVADAGKRLGASLETFGSKLVSDIPFLSETIDGLSRAIDYLNKDTNKTLRDVIGATTLLVGSGLGLKALSMFGPLSFLGTSGSLLLGHTPHALALAASGVAGHYAAKGIDALIPHKSGNEIVKEAIQKLYDEGKISEEEANLAFERAGISYEIHRKGATTAEDIAREDYLDSLGGIPEKPIPVSSSTVNVSFDVESNVNISAESGVDTGQITNSISENMQNFADIAVRAIYANINAR